MSRNFYIAAKKGKVFEEFDTIQFPTKMSEQIYNATDCIERYKEYAKEFYGTRKLADNHIKSLNTWIEEKEDAGYEIRYGLS